MIFSAFERRVAARYLRPRRKEGYISLIAILSFLGIALGVATLIIVMAVMNGFRAELLDRVMGMNGHLNVYDSQSGALGNYESLSARIKAVPGVINAMPTVEGQALISLRGQASGAMVRGLRPEDFRARPRLSSGVVAGAVEDFGDDRIAIGHRMARRLGVTLGDSLPLISPQGTPSAFGTVPRMRAYTIAVIFNVDMYEYDNGFIYMPLPAAQAFFRLPENGVSGIEVQVATPDRIKPFRAAVQEAVGFDGRVADWQQANASFVSALEIERNVMFLILTLIIVVAALNIISSMVMLVKEKGRAIAILRTMGATRGMILRIFFLTGASIGVVGTLAGLGLGVAFTLNLETIRHVLETVLNVDLFAAEIRFFTQIPARIDWGEVAQVVGMGLALSFLATLPPAWRAARLDPVEALRYE